MTLCRFFQDGGHDAVNILLLSGFMTSRLQEGASDSCLMLDYVRVINFRIIIIIIIKNYLRIKFRPDISIHGQVITTSGC